MFVIVDDCGPAYRTPAAVRPRGFSASRAAFLNHLLPPNLLSVTAPDGGVSRLAKCCVLSLPDLDRACSPAPADPFVRARLFRQVELVWARDPASRERVTAAVVSGLASLLDPAVTPLAGWPPRRRRLGVLALIGVAARGTARHRTLAIARVLEREAPTRC